MFQNAAQEFRELQELAGVHQDHPEWSRLVRNQLPAITRVSPGSSAGKLKR